MHAEMIAATARVYATRRSVLRAFLTGAAATLLVVSACHAATMSDADGDKLQKLLAERSSLEPYVGGFPPRFDSDAQAKEVTARLGKVQQGLEALTKKYPTAQMYLELGIAYAEGHNADMPGAWDKAEKAFQKSISLNPKGADAHTELGHLYVNTSPDLAPKAEKEFKTALSLSGNAPDPQIWFGLMFAHYYQGHLDDAVTAGETAVKLAPNNDAYKKALGVVEEKRDETKAGKK